MELKNPLLVPNKWLQRTSSQNQVLAELNLSKKPEIPQSGHQAGTGARILKCDAMVRDHACRKKATELLSTTELPFLRTIFFKEYIDKAFHLGILGQNLRLQHAHSSHLLRWELSEDTEGRIWPCLE